MLKTYGAAPYGAELKKLEKEIKDKERLVAKLRHDGMSGLSHRHAPHAWRERIHFVNHSS